MKRGQAALLPDRKPERVVTEFAHSLRSGWRRFAVWMNRTLNPVPLSYGRGYWLPRSAMSKSTIILVTVAAWLIGCVYSAYYYVTSILASPDIGPRL